MGIGEDPRNRRGSIAGNGGGLFEERGGGSILGIEGKTMVGDWKFVRRMRNQSMPPDQQHQHNLGTYYRCKFSGSIPDTDSETLGRGPRDLCCKEPSRGYSCVLSLRTTALELQGLFQELEVCVLRSQSSVLEGMWKELGVSPRMGRVSPSGPLEGWKTFISQNGKKPVQGSGDGSAS